MAEFTDIAAYASGWKYNKYAKGTWFQQKFRHVWFEGGIHNVDWDAFWEAYLLNQVEDMALGMSGKASGQAAKNLGFTTGFQTGPAL